MKLLKLIGFFFLIYFIRRFIEMYRTVKRMQLQEEMRNTPPKQGPESGSKVVDADFKVVD